MQMKTKLKTFYYNIDILGSCNLKCPTCPQGNSNIKLEKNLMSLDLFNQILDKAQEETNISGIGLFNWTEPLLHPRCADFIKNIKNRNLKCHLSTNLNYGRNLEEIIEANPNSIRISISGWDNKNYTQTHFGGDINKVKENMHKIYAYLHYAAATTKIYLLWHKYKNNDKDEQLMKDYALKCGFGFNTCEAYLMPLELVMDRWNNVRGKLPIEDNLLTTLDTAKTLCQNNKSKYCRLQQREITIDSLGNVHLCCALFNPALSKIGNYLDISINKIQEYKFNNETCEKCLNIGGHNYVTFQWKFKERMMQKFGNIKNLFF